MSYIFRNDSVSIGDRVVVRRKLDTGFSDVIGHVVSTSPLVIRPQEVGGYPSDVDAVEIPTSVIYRVKKLSARRVRNSEIRKAELAWRDPGSGASWTTDGQWLLDDVALPLGRSAAFSTVPIDEIASLYGGRLRFGLPERLGSSAEKLLDDTFTLGEELSVMVCAGDKLADVSGASSGVSLRELEDGSAWGCFSGSAVSAVEGVDFYQTRVAVSDTTARQRLEGQGFIEHHRYREAWQ